MDAREFFQDVVHRNYFEFFDHPDDISLLWNAVVSLNSVAEYLALEQLNHAQISRKQFPETAHSSIYARSKIRARAHSH